MTTEDIKDLIRFAKLTQADIAREMSIDLPERSATQLNYTITGERDYPDIQEWLAKRFGMSREIMFDRVFWAVANVRKSA